MKEYIVYDFKTDDILFIGSKKEIAKEFNVKPATVSFWRSKANVERLKQRKNTKRGKIIFPIKNYKDEE